MDVRNKFLTMCMNNYMQPAGETAHGAGSQHSLTTPGLWPAQPLLSSNNHPSLIKKCQGRCTAAQDGDHGVLGL